MIWGFFFACSCNSANPEFCLLNKSHFLSLHMVKTPILYYFTLAMTALYIVLGLFLMFAPNMEVLLPGWKHWVLGLILIAYALVRFKRLKKLKQSMEQKVENSFREQEQ